MVLKDHTGITLPEGRILMVPKDHTGITLPEDRILMVLKDRIGITLLEDSIGTVPEMWPNKLPHEFSQNLI